MDTDPWARFRGAGVGFRLTSRAMRVVDLDRDMSDVIPTGTTRDSEFLFERMTRATLDATRPAPGRRILDVASGFGQDAIALRASSGADVIGAEPSARMMAWTRFKSGETEGPLPEWVRGWGDALPFADDCFDGAFCKGALDHFDQPLEAIGEMARVTRPGGRVVLAIANFDSFSCRAARCADDVREGAFGAEVARGRRHYDVPADHFTRYELGLMREQASRHVVLEEVIGISMAWGFPFWTRAVQALPDALADRILTFLDGAARKLPGLADVIVLAGRPREDSD